MISCLDAYEGKQMNISWHDKNPIEYKPQTIQIEGYQLTSIETSSDVVHYVTGGKTILQIIIKSVRLLFYSTPSMRHLFSRLNKLKACILFVFYQLYRILSLHER